MKKVALLALLPFALAACNTYNVQVLGTLDADNKTVTTSAGASGAIGMIKQRLRQEGWKVLVGTGPVVTVGATKGDTFTQTSANSRTRYQLRGSFTALDINIFTGQVLFAYDVGIVDLQTGEEIVTMSGRGEGATIADRFVEAVKANTR